jgi:hypothetical protein
MGAKTVTSQEPFRVYLEGTHGVSCYVDMPQIEPTAVSKKSSKGRPCDCECDQDGCVPAGFQAKWGMLAEHGKTASLRLDYPRLQQQLSNTVHCIGCRAGVEKLVTDVASGAAAPLEGLSITPGKDVLLHFESIDSSDKATRLLAAGQAAIQQASSCGKAGQKRCHLHSLKWRASGPWTDFWELLPPKSRQKVTRVKCSLLWDQVQRFAMKHQLCSRCKNSLIGAFDYLCQPKTPSAPEFDELSCSQECCENGKCELDNPRHIIPPVDCSFSELTEDEVVDSIQYCTACDSVQVPYKDSDIDYLSNLMRRAQIEKSKTNHRRHIDDGQSEVLTCLGLVVWERIHSLWQKLHVERHTRHLYTGLVLDGLMYMLEMLVHEKEQKSESEKISRSKARRQRKKELKLLEKESCSESQSQAESQAETAELADDTQSTIQDSPAQESESGQEKDGDNPKDVDEQSKEELELLAAMGWQRSTDDEGEEEDDEELMAELQQLKEMKEQQKAMHDQDERKELRGRLQANFQSLLSNWPEAGAGASTSK